MLVRKTHTFQVLNKHHANLWTGTVMHKLIYYLLEQWLNSIRRHLELKQINIIVFQETQEEKSLVTKYKVECATISWQACTAAASRVVTSL
jgi:hypothetical protein